MSRPEVPAPFYIDGPFPDGTYAVCDAATMRILRVFKDYEDLQLAAGKKLVSAPAFGIDHCVTGIPEAPAPSEEPYPEPLSHFAEGQWWVTELDAMAKQDGATDDQKRAVAVVHHLLKAALASPTAAPQEPPA